MLGFLSLFILSVFVMYIFSTILSIKLIYSAIFTVPRCMNMYIFVKLVGVFYKHVLFVADMFLNFKLIKNYISPCVFLLPFN